MTRSLFFILSKEHIVTFWTINIQNMRHLFITFTSLVYSFSTQQFGVNAFVNPHTTNNIMKTNRRRIDVISTSIRRRANISSASIHRHFDIDSTSMRRWWILDQYTLDVESKSNWCPFRRSIDVELTPNRRWIDVKSLSNGCRYDVNATSIRRPYRDSWMQRAPVK